MEVGQGPNVGCSAKGKKNAATVAVHVEFAARSPDDFSWPPARPGVGNSCIVSGLSSYPRPNHCFHRRQGAVV
jgi:hypothetical protein